MAYDFDFSFLPTHWDVLLAGAWSTARMSTATIVLGFVLGAVLAILRTQGPAWARRAVVVYVDVIRNTPLVIQAFWLFFGLASLQIRVPAVTAAVIALTINVSAYTAEIVRAGIESIPRGQIEAASCLGMSRWKVLRLVVLPQAVERMYPALVSQFVLMKLTSAGYGVQSETFRGFEIYLVVAVLYLVMSWLLRLLMAGLAQLAFRRRRRLGTSL